MQKRFSIAFLAISSFLPFGPTKTRVCIIRICNLYMFIPPFMYVSVRVRASVLVSTCVCTCLGVCVCVCVRVRLCACVCTCACVRACVRACVNCSGFLIARQKNYT